MGAGTVTPTEAGMGPSVVGIAASIGAKIRDAAQEAKEEREKAKEKGMEPKKGSLFKSALRNKFNPIKSKKAKAQWSKQFDWNKKSADTAQQVKTPSETGGADGKAKLKEFIAGGFTAIIKDTTAMRAKMDGIQALSSANLEQATRTTGSLTMIKESVDAQTEIRRKALEDAKFARAERRLERTKDSAGVVGTKGPGGSEEQQPGQGGDDGGGGWLDKLLTGLGFADLISNFLPKGGFGAIINKINPFKGPTTKGGKPITGTRPVRPTGGARVTTSGGQALKGASNLKNVRNLPGMKTGILSAIFAAFEFKDRKDQGQTNTQAAIGTTGSTLGGLGGAIAGGKAGAAAGAAIGAAIGAPFAGVGAAPGAAIGATIGGIAGSILGGFGGSWAGGKLADTATGVDKDITKSLGPNESQTSLADQSGGLGSFSEGGIVPLNRGGIVDNPTRTMLFPGDKVIPLNRSAGKNLLEEGSGDLPFKAQAAMILGVSTAFLGKGMGGSAADSVAQEIRKASKGVGIANLTFTSSLGGGQFRALAPDQAAENFMEKLFDKVALFNIKLDGSGGSGGGGNNTTPPGADLTGTGVTREVDLAANTHSDVGFTPNQQFGDRGGRHKGSDIGTSGQKGYYVGMRKKGKVVHNSYQADGAGHWVGIDVGGGVEYRFMHLAHPSPLKVGSEYNGETIGEIGNTGRSFGEHLHFEKLVNGVHVDPKEDAKALLDIGKGLNRQFDPSNNTTVVTAPSSEDPGTSTTPKVEKEASDGMWGPAWLPWNAKKGIDKARKGLTLGGNAFGYEARHANVTDPEMRRMMGLSPLQRSAGGSTPINKIRVKTTGRNKTKSYQRWDGTQWLTGTGADAQKYKSLYDAQQKAGSSLGKVAAPPQKKPAPATRPAASPQQQPQAAAVVMPPTQNVGKKTADASGSFGSSIPSAKTGAGGFADFLYPDLV